MSKSPTFAAPTIAVATSVVGPEYIRLPQAGEHDPLFGLTRSYLNLLILPLKENAFCPSVRSSVLRQGGAKTGVRLVNVASLRAYLKKQMQSPGEKSPDAPLDSVGSSPAPVSSVEFLRLPREKERDPLFGLSRSFLNQLILPCKDNGYRPPVLSHVLRRRGYRTGIRLISVDSLRDYIKSNEETGRRPADSPAEGPGADEVKT